MTDNTPQNLPVPRKPRSRYSAEFKASILQACNQSNTSIAQVARDHGLNANLIHNWKHRAKQINAQRNDLNSLAVFRVGATDRLFTGVTIMIRIDQYWLATEPLDMRAGPDTALARVIQVFGQAKPHHAYLFTNKRGNRMKILVHDGLGVWLCARRLNEGKFHWAELWRGDSVVLSPEQCEALVKGLPWHRLEASLCVS